MAFAAALTALYAGAWVWAVTVQAVPGAVAWIVVVVNLLTFAAYGLDKRAASRGQWRVSERALHLWGLAGGWPAAWWAQRMLRHKRSKPSFQRVYWCTVWLHALAIGGWQMARQGAG